MSTLPWTGHLARPKSTLGWATQTVRFPRSYVAATIALAHHLHQEGQRFEAYHPRYAQCWIETEQTPWVHFSGSGYPNADRFRDVQVRLETTWLTFQLQTNGIGAGAVLTVFGFPAPFASRFTDLVAHDPKGQVVGVHREALLEGAAESDDDELGEAMRARAAELEIGEVGVVRADLDLARIPSDAGLRVDLENGRLVVERPPRRS